MHLRQASKRGMKKRNVIVGLEVTHITSAVFPWQADDSSFKSQGRGLGSIVLGIATTKQ